MQLMATLLCPKLKKSLSKTATAKLSSGEIESNVQKINASPFASSVAKCTVYLMFTKMEHLHYIHLQLSDSG